MLDFNYLVACDNAECENFEYACDAASYDGDLIPCYCGVCGNDITHTAIPIN